MRREIRFRHCKDRQEWLRAKVVRNAISLLWSNFSGRTFGPGDWVWLCPATDAYQPIEQERHLTYEILRFLVEKKIPTRILTKSESVCDDEDTIIRHKDLIQVGFTITTLSDDLGRKWEPNASLIHDRIKALRFFHANGVKTWVSVEPMLDDKPLALVEKSKEDVDYWVFGKDNYVKRDLDYLRIRNEITAWFEAHELTNYLIKKELREA